MTVRNTYVNPWLAMGSLFIPVIPTQSANLAGTASILTQWWIGQGVEAFGFAGAYSANYRFNSNGFNGIFNYDVELQNKFGGFVEGQYYFNNQWFINALYGVSKAFNVTRSRAQWAGFGGLPVGAGMEMGLLQRPYAPNDPADRSDPVVPSHPGHQVWLAVFVYRGPLLPDDHPTCWCFSTFSNASSNFGDNHRVEFVGFFYF